MSMEPDNADLADQETEDGIDDLMKQQGDDGNLLISSIPFVQGVKI